MVIKKIVALFKKDSSRVAGEPEGARSGGPKMKYKKKVKAGKNPENDWASQSRMYRKLSERQKENLDKIIDILDKEDLD